jgi:predicted kinase
VVLSGLPGTGKSHFAGELTRLVPFQVLGSDRIRKLLVPKPRYTPGEHSRVFPACHRLIEIYLARGCRVLYDATNLTKSSRRPLYRICERLDVPLALVRFTAPQETVRRRLADRAVKPKPGDCSDANWLVYSSLSLHEEPIGRHHFTVDSSGGRSPVLDDIARLAGAGG